MALTELLFGSPVLGQIGIVQFDATIEEDHVDEAQVSDHPVEEGSDTTDHIRKLPDMITLTGMITNTPLVFLASLQAPSPLEGDIFPTSDRVETAYSELRRIIDEKEIVDVITSLREYSNMALLSMRVSRNAALGNALQVTISLREIVKTAASAVGLPIPKDVANSAKKNKGKKNKKDGAGSSSKASSILSKISSAAKNLF